MHHWIDSPDTLAARLAHGATSIGLDTEFVRERTFWPQLALVQVAIDATGGGREVLLVDPLVPGMAQALVPMLVDRDVLKVMHSASEDLVAFRHACGVVPQPLFDTQVAAALAGVGAGIGYQKLVQQVEGVSLAKGETRSDWLRRPLSPAQLDYAAADVEHLAALHADLDARLDALGRRDWLAEDCARMVRNAEQDDGERWPHLSMRAAQFLDPDAQRRLLRLLRWREQQARSSDRPRSWILDNELAASLARSVPASIDALQSRLDATPKAPRKLAGALWHALQTPLEDEDEAPPVQAEEHDRATMRKLQDAVAARSAELGLPDGVLASRRWLEALLDGKDWPGALSGWRRRELEERLAPMLGAAAASRAQDGMATAPLSAD